MGSGILALRFALWTVAVALGGLQASAHPYRLSSDDAISYLDVADAYLRHDWTSVLNGYWSPLYSSLLAFAKWVSHAGSPEELLLFRVLNFAIYLAAIASFDFFLRRVMAAHERVVARGSLAGLETDHAFVPVPRWIWITTGYLLFLWSTLIWINLRSDTPDLCTTALVYVAAGVLLGTRGAPLSLWRGLAFGAIVGLACLSKTAMFVIAPALLVAGGLVGGDRRRAPTRIGTALLGAALVAGPFVAALSTSRGRLTFGDTGRLNYTWLVNPGSYIVPDQHWQGWPPQFGAPRHASRLVWARPAAFEFAQPVRGTFPPWGDPSYWYEGLNLRFDAAKQWSTVQVNARFYWSLFVELLVLFYVALLAGGGAWRSAKAAVTEQWALLLPAFTGLAVYLVATNLAVSNIRTQPSTRYVASFIVLVFAAAVAGIRLTDSRRPRVTLWAMTAAALLLGGSGLARLTASELHAVLGPADDPSWKKVAASMCDLDVQPGDAVAIVGDKREHEVWARVAQVRIVAQVPDSRSFLRTDPALQADVRRALARTGAKALVFKPRAGGASGGPGADWTSIADTSYYAVALTR
ncbi:MAG: hypothetical protein DMF89_12880 [Acidobacteria bacterium]|nr:MAG: hypothetical protein DMF89_12880 [Acidobacteriota bacterium]